MRCAACQAMNRDGALFCRSCGSRLDQVCPRCRTPFLPGYRYCDACGMALPAPAPSEDEGDKGPEQLEGERKQVTVMFCDIERSMSLAERLGDEAMHRLLNEFFDLALGVVHRYEGTINQFLGDGFMALFGAPVAHEDHERRAILSALGILQALRLRQARERDWAGRDLRVRIGMNSGPVVVGRIGNNLRDDFTAVGDTTNLAARLQQEAEPGTILASEAVVRPIQAYLKVRPVGPMPIKGRDEPVVAYRIVELLSRGWRPEPPRLHHLVGREHEMAALRRALLDVERGRAAGRAIGLIGDPGMGKSRLISELRRETEARPIAWLEGHCVSYGVGVPYRPWIDVVRGRFEIDDGDAPDVVGEKSRRGLEALGITGSEHLGHVLRLLGVEEERDPAAPLSPEAIHSGTVEALRQIVLRTGEREPTVLVIENLQWMDRSSEDFLDAVVDSAARARLLVLATYRPPYRPRWMERAHVHQIALAPLTAEESLALVRAMPGGGSLSEVVDAQILGKAEGNPFFIEELTRHVVEHGQGRRDADLPGTVQEVVMARIDRLPSEAKRLVQEASVIGRLVPRRLLAELWGDAGPLERPLAELERMELIHEETSGGEPIYVFKQALIQEVAYGSLLTSRRQVLHLRVAATLEHLHAGRLEDVDDRLAYHYARTTRSDKAIEYLGRLAGRAARWYANAEAVAAYGEALAHARRLPPGAARERHILELSLHQAHSLHFLGRFDEILELLLRQEPEVKQLGEPALAGEYYFRLGRTYDVLADHERAVECARRAIDEAQRGGDRTVEGKAHFVLAYVGYWTGRYADGLAHGRQAVAALEGSRERWWLGEAHWVIGINHAMTGEFEAALAALARAQAIGESLMDPRLQSTVAFTAGGIHALRGDPERAIERCRRAVELARDPVGTAVARGFLGASLLEKGEAEAAIPLLERSVEQLGRFRIRQTHSWFTALLAQACFVAGHLDRARGLAQQGLEMTLHVHAAQGAGWAQRTLGHVAQAEGDAAEAARWLKDAAATFATIGARYEEARTRLDLAALDHARGDRRAAAREMERATLLLRDLSVRRYDRVLSALAADLGASPAG
ncbi:MAG TPA: adenylate/guanylate cyclase domain-containing protein [Verrucomicrobiae bacterium]|jgi:class 3 adenylate cyclase/tetratricopeptide (TPR) repeat protein|nr:adenylate/guanylate cyclase domain-containing protein [Verrucomicrobiae bacterium]